MFDNLDPAAPVVTAAGSGVPTVDDLTGLLERLANLDGAGESEAVLVDRLTVLERLKGGLAAAQSRVTSTLRETRVADETARGVRPDRRGRGLAAEVALARRESPHRGGRHLGMATALVHEMPHTLAALSRGDISEYRAMLVVQETAILTLEDRRTVDAEMADALPTLGDRAAAGMARAIGYRLDPTSAIRRVRGAEADRHVSLRPAPDTMTYLTAFLPVAQGVACKVALDRQAAAIIAAGDERSRSQILADLVVQLLTGQATADGVDVEVTLVMTDAALLGTDETATSEQTQDAAHVEGFGPIPADLARGLVRDADRAWLRRLFASPDGSDLVAMDSRRRLFDGQLRRFVVLRDQICRTPWCDAPVRHVDHVQEHAGGGATPAQNG